jgi:hypothetical protein
MIPATGLRLRPGCVHSEDKYQTAPPKTAGTIRIALAYRLINSLLLICHRFAFTPLYGNRHKNTGQVACEDEIKINKIRETHLSAGKPPQRFDIDVLCHSLWLKFDLTVQYNGRIRLPLNMPALSEGGYGDYSSWIILLLQRDVVLCYHLNCPGAL